MWNPFARKKVFVPEPSTDMEDAGVALEQKVPDVLLALPVIHIQLTKFKWVVYKNQVAIVADLDSSGYATIHYVNDKGETVGSERVSGGMLRIARYSEIPEARRQIDYAQAAVLGYV